MAESFTTRLIQRLQIEQKKNDHGGVYAFACSDHGTSPLMEHLPREP